MAGFPRGLVALARHDFLSHPKPQLGRDETLAGGHHQHLALQIFVLVVSAALTAIEKLLDTLTACAGAATFADYIQGILSRKAQTRKPGYSQSLYNLKDAAKMLNFLQTNNIMDMRGLMKNLSP